MRVKDLEKSVKLKLVESGMYEHHVNLFFNYAIGEDTRINLYIREDEIVKVVPQYNNSLKKMIKNLSELSNGLPEELKRDLLTEFRDDLQTLDNYASRRMQPLMTEITVAYAKMLQAILLEEVHKIDDLVAQKYAETEQKIRKLNAAQ